MPLKRRLCSRPLPPGVQPSKLAPDPDDVDQRVSDDDELSDDGNGPEGDKIHRDVDQRYHFHNMVHERAWVQKGASEVRAASR
eukprot:309773-Pleurochrysis_carterae.AAC.1